MTKKIYLETLKSVPGRSILHYFKKSYFTLSRPRTFANSEDGTICNNGLRLKGVLQYCHKHFQLKC